MNIFCFEMGKTIADDLIGSLQIGQGDEFGAFIHLSWTISDHTYCYASAASLS